MLISQKHLTNGRINTKINIGLHFVAALPNTIKEDAENDGGETSVK